MAGQGQTCGDKNVLTGVKKHCSKNFSGSRRRFCCSRALRRCAAAAAKKRELKCLSVWLHEGAKVCEMMREKVTRPEQHAQDPCRPCPWTSCRRLLEVQLQLKTMTMLLLLLLLLLLLQQQLLMPNLHECQQQQQLPPTPCRCRRMMTRSVGE